MMYLMFQLHGDSSSGLTKIWSVTTIQSPYAALGFVRWYGPWRKYCFMPGFGTTYDQNCLREIADFCEVQTREHKA